MKGQVHVTKGMLPLHQTKTVAGVSEGLAFKERKEKVC